MRIQFLIASVFLLGSTWAAGSDRGAALPGVAQKEVTLFTEQEARALRVEENAWDPVPRARSASPGPLIIVKAPGVKRVEGNDTIRATSPTTFEVSFEENQAPVDMSSLEVTARKGLFHMSLTEKLAPFVEGTTLTVGEMEVPAGSFQIQILIQDREGQETAQTYRLIVEN